MSGLRWAAAASHQSRVTRRWASVAGYALVAVAMLFSARLMHSRLGAEGFLLALVGVLGLAVYGVISFRDLRVPFLVWILTVCGFRFLWNIQAPGLPDLYLDRMGMIWVGVVFSVKFVAENRRLRGPHLLDWLVLLNLTYIFGQVFVYEMRYFSVWVASVAMPAVAFLLAKNIMARPGHVHSMMWVLLSLSIYYNLTSVAEKFDINWLIWPKYIVNAGGEFSGRSQGPFLHAPLFGTVIGMLLPVHLYCMAATNKTWARLLLGLSLLLGFGGLYFTYTRGSWLAGLAALAATAALNRKRYLRYLLPSLVIGPVVAVAFLGLTQDEFLKERVEEEDTIGSRVGTAVTVFRVWRDHPLLGVGFFRYRDVRENYIQAVEVPGMPVIRYQQFRHNAIHDIYFGPMAELGVIGAAIQFAIYFLILRAFLRSYLGRRRDDEFAGNALPVLGGIMFGYLVGGIAFDYRFFSVVGVLFMTCAGITYGYRPDAGGDPAKTHLIAS